MTYSDVDEKQSSGGPLSSAVLFAVLEGTPITSGVMVVYDDGVE